MVRSVDEIPCGNRGPWNDASDSCFRKVILLLGEEWTVGPMHGGRDTSLRLLLYPWKEIKACTKVVVTGVKKDQVHSSPTVES